MGCQGGLSAEPGKGCWVYNRGPENDVSCVPEKDLEFSFIKHVEQSYHNG